MKWTVIVLIMSLGLAGSAQAQAPDPIEEEFQVNSYTTSWQVYPAVAVDPQGNFVVVWMSDGSYGTDTDYSSVQGQRVAIPIFTDGFESGNTSAWSSTQ